MKLRCVVLIIMCWVTAQVQAWNAIGHQVMGHIAYAHLTDVAKQQVDALLFALAPIYPQADFVGIQTWADELRANGIHAFNSWHYISKPYVLDNVRYFKPDYHNAPWAINQSITVLQNDDAPPLVRGFFLAMLVHVVGDIHQPMHCVTLFSNDYPQGDRGGNRFPINTDSASNLHQFWDQGLGLLSTVDTAELAQQLQRDYPSMTDLIMIQDPEIWAAEGYQIAVNHAYQLPAEDYIKTGQDIVAQRLVLAGYRLAYLLNQLL